MSLQFRDIFLTVALLVGTANAQEIVTSGGELNALDRITEANQDRECASLQPGETRVINEPRERSVTGVARGYSLTRDAETGEYRLALAIAFGDIHRNGRDLRQTHPALWQQVGSFGEDSVEASRLAYLERTNQCLAQYDARMISPGGGRVRIRVSGGTESAAVESGLPMHRVNIVGDHNRANSRAWPADIPCATIAHEIMHLLGLCDGYEERTTNVNWEWGAWPARARIYDCRNIIPQARMMNLQWLALETTYQLSLCTCQTPASGPPCSTRPFERRDQESTTCPEGYLFENLNIRNKESLDEYVAIASAFGAGRILLVRTLPPRTDSPFSQAEWEMITRPRCARNLYPRCARNRNLTSFIEGCAPQPAECENLP